MTRFLLDEIVTPALVDRLVKMGHDAVHVKQLGLINTADDLIAEAARKTSRAIITNNFRDYAEQRGVVVLFYGQHGLPAGAAAQAAELAKRIKKWIAANPTPYLGPHWI
jgi:hypothetical protein